jgi:hypothetical protein
MVGTVSTVARPIYHGRINDEKIPWPHSVLYDALMPSLHLCNGHTTNTLCRRTAGLFSVKEGGAYT